MTHPLTHTQYDPTWTDPRMFTPIFTLEKIYNAKIFDVDDNEVPCVISYWLGENGEIREVKVNIKEAEFPDFDHDVSEIILKKHGKFQIMDKIERI